MAIIITHICDDCGESVSTEPSVEGVIESVDVGWITDSLGPPDGLTFPHNFCGEDCRAACLAKYKAQLGTTVAAEVAAAMTPKE